MKQLKIALLREESICYPIGAIVGGVATCLNQWMREKQAEYAFNPVCCLFSCLLPLLFASVCFLFVFQFVVARRRAGRGLLNLSPLFIIDFQTFEHEPVRNEMTSFFLFGCV